MRSACPTYTILIVSGENSLMSSYSPQHPVLSLCFLLGMRDPVHSHMKEQVGLKLVVWVALIFRFLVVTWLLFFI
jgi:hypothetical protein